MGVKSDVKSRLILEGPQSEDLYGKSGFLEGQKCHFFGRFSGVKNRAPTTVTEFHILGVQKSGFRGSKIDILGVKNGQKGSKIVFLGSKIGFQAEKSGNWSFFGVKIGQKSGFSGKRVKKCQKMVKIVVFDEKSVSGGFGGF